MICGKCGADNPEDVKFCTSCGASVAKPDNHRSGSDPAKKKRFFIILGAAVAVIALVIALCVALSGTGAENAADDFCEAVLKLDLNSAVQMLPPTVPNYVKEALELGDAKVKVVGSKELEADEIKELDELYSMYFDTEEGYIAEGAIVYVNIVLPDRNLSKDVLQLVMVKIADQWYLEPLSTYSKLAGTKWQFGKLNFLK